MTGIRRNFFFFLIAAFAITALAHVTIAAQNDRQAEALLQRALNKEFIDGDIAGAIKQYNEVVSTYPSSAVAAKALLRLGQAYERTANTAEAQKAYERVVRGYSNQKEAVAEAQSHLKTSVPPTTAYAPKNLGRACVGCFFDTMSPDGRYLLGNGLLDLVTGEQRDSDNYRENLAFSPDGKQVAFTSYDADFVDIHISTFSPKEDGPEKVVLHNREYTYNVPFGWTRDGKEILAVLAREDDTWLIAAVSINGGSVRPIKSLEWREPDKTSLSPDGKYIAYDAPIAKENQINRDIFLLATDGSVLTTLVENPARDTSPMWTPDGKAIVFESDRSGKLGLWKLEIVDGKAKGEPAVVKQIDSEIRPMGFAGNGAFYYGVNPIQPRDIVTADIDLSTGSVTRPASRAIERFAGRNFATSYSPDGKSLAFFSRRSSSGAVSLVIHSVTSEQEREIPTVLLGTPNTPAWAPDGKSLLSRIGQDIHLIDLNSHEDRLIKKARFAVPRFSPDGKRIYYVYRKDDSSRNERTLAAYDLEKQEETVLFQGQVPSGADERLAVSPDGRQIATTLAPRTSPTLTDPQGTATSKPVVRLVPTAGGASKTVPSPDTQQLSIVEWSSDNKDVLVQRGNGQLWWVSAGGGDARRIGTGNFPKIESLSPDGKHIANTETGKREPNEVWIDPELLKASTPREPGGSVYVVRVDPATGKIRGAVTPLNGKADGSCAPAWSPDGKSIAFKRILPNNNGTTVWAWIVRSLATGEEKSYSLAGRAGQGYCWIAPLWSHDSKRLLNGSFLEANGKVFQADLVSSQFKDLDVPNYKPAMVISMDDRTLYMTAHDPKDKKTSIIGVDLVSGEQKPVWVSSTPTDPENLVPLRLALSPDGRSLALVLSDSSKAQLIRVGTDGQNYKSLYTSSTERAAGAWLSRSGLAWSRDGRGLFFMEADKSQLRLMRIPSDGGKPEFTGLEIPSTDAVFDVSPDGTQIAIASPGLPKISPQAAASR